MKKNNEIETPESYYERHPLVLLISVITSAVLVFFTFYLFKYQEFEIHGWALILVPPALISTFQTLLYILNPYAMLFKDRLEINRSMFSNKTWYFNDIKKVSEISKSSFVITYNDDDKEVLNLRGIKPSHVQKLRDALHKCVYESLERRDD
ncbi:MAG: hypothetical protein JNM96_01550 [Bacteroidia bacterium]|nr:hypothetical protein [Bacteroidia bacterium]